MKKKIIFAAIFFIFAIGVNASNFESIKIGGNAKLLLSQLDNMGIECEVKNVEGKDVVQYSYNAYGEIGLYEGEIYYLVLFVRKNIIIGYSMLLVKPNPDYIEDCKAMVLEYINEEGLTMDKNNISKPASPGTVKSYYGYTDTMEANISICSAEEGYCVLITALRI